MHSGTYAWFPIYTSFNLVYTSKAKHNRFCHTVRTYGGLKGLNKRSFFLLTGISITRTGISNKNTTAGTGILPKFQVGNGIGTPPSGPSWKGHGQNNFSRLHESNITLRRIQVRCSFKLRRIFAQQLELGRANRYMIGGGGVLKNWGPLP